MKKIYYLINIILLSFGINEVKAQCSANGYKVFITDAVKICANDSLNLDDFVKVKGGMFSISANPPINATTALKDSSFGVRGSYLKTMPKVTSINALFLSTYLSNNKGKRNIPDNTYNKFETVTIYYYYSCSGTLKSGAINITVIPVMIGAFSFNTTTPTPNSNVQYLGSTKLKNATFDIKLIDNQVLFNNSGIPNINNVATICSGSTIDLSDFVYPTTSYINQAGGNITFDIDTTNLILDSSTYAGNIISGIYGSKTFGNNTTTGQTIISKINNTSANKIANVAAIFTDQNGCTFTSIGKIIIAPIPTAFKETFTYHKVSASNQNLLKSIEFTNFNYGLKNYYSSSTCSGSPNCNVINYLNIDSLSRKSIVNVNVCQNKTKIYIGSATNVTWSIKNISFLNVSQGTIPYQAELIALYNQIGSPYTVVYNAQKDSAFLLRNEAFVNQYIAQSNSNGILNNSIDYIISLQKTYNNTLYASCPITVIESAINISTPPMAIFKPLTICATKDTAFNLLNVEIGTNLFGNKIYAPFTSANTTINFSGTGITNNVLQSSVLKDSIYIFNANVNYGSCVNALYKRNITISKIRNINPLGNDTTICAPSSAISVSKFIKEYNNPAYSSSKVLYSGIVTDSKYTATIGGNMENQNITNSTLNISIVASPINGSTVFNNYGCPITIKGTKLITVNPSNSFTAKDTSVCSSAISYNLLSGVNYTNGSFSYKLLNAGLNDTILKGNTLNIGNWNNLNTITDVNVRYSYLDNNGCTSNLDRKISVKSANQLDLGADYNICNDLASLNLKPKFNVVNALSNFGVDSVKLAFSNPNLFNGYIFNSKDVATGTYTVNGAITNQYGCTSTDFLRINVGYRPVVNLGGDSTICVNSDTLISYNLNNLLKDKVGTWSGSGVNDSLLTLRGSQAGNYQVRYNYTSPDGCSVNASKLFRINYVRVDAGRDYALCQNEQTPIQINANTRVWDDFENTKLLDNVGYSTISPTAYMNGYSFLTYLAPKGKYSFELRYTSALGCVATDTLNIGIGESKAISFGADTSICLSDTLSKLNLKKLVSLDTNTTFSGDGVANGFFLVKNRPANSYIIKATHVTNEGCTSEAVKTINLIALSARITSDSSFVSAGNGSRFYSNSVNANSYKWIFKSKLTSDTIFKENPFYYGNHAKDTINVSLQVTSPEGCKLTVTASQNFIVKRLSSDLDVTETGNFNFLNGSPDSKLYASPVPFSNYVTVTTQTKDAQKATFSLTNNLGVEVLISEVWLKENVTDSVLNTESLPSGVYYLKVVSKDYQRVLKLVKE